MTLRRRRWIGALAALPLLAVAAPAPVDAQSGAEATKAKVKPAKSPPKAKTKGAGAATPGAAGAPSGPDPAAIDRSLDTAEKAVDAGRADAAISTLGGVLSTGGLPARQMARALYLRGLAYRRQGKPAQAIADLTSALWLKGGLTEEQRAAALKARADASREAGLPEPALPPSSTGQATTRTPATAVPAPAAPAPPVAPSPAVVASGPAPQARRPPPAQSRAPLAARTPVATPAAAPAAGPAVSSWSSGTEVRPRDGTTVSVSRPAEPPAESGLGSFLTGLFGGGATAPPPRPAPPAEPAPAVTAAPPAATVAAPAAPARPAATTVRTASLPTAEKPAATGAGRFRLQVALVRTREEAHAVAQRLKREFAGAIGGGEPVIDTTVIGNMGTFYRVRAGSFASARDGEAQCRTVRSKGLECMVVAR